MSSIRYLIDANLPYHFSIWNSQLYQHVFDIDPSWSDNELWNYSEINGLTIITKDADFSNRILFKTPPPRVIHIRIGNMRLGALYDILSRNWNDILLMSSNHKLVTVYSDRIEGMM